MTLCVVERKRKVMKIDNTYTVIDCPDTLPDKLHELLALALADFDIISKTPGYEVDMSSWHEADSNTGKCAVCLAGAVMANTLKVQKHISMSINDVYDSNLATKLRTLDSLRGGYVNDALAALRREQTADFSYPEPEAYHYNPLQWRKDMDRLLAWLKKRDL